jgi:F420-non-reducing hydrogenase iron-sulfur subunit
MKNLIEYMGLEPERFQTSWISGSEANKFQQTMEKLVADITRLGPNRKLRDMR